MDSRFYPGVEADPVAMTSDLRKIFPDNYQVQSMQVSATTVIQARKSGTLRDLAGLSSALTIKITPETGGTRIEIGMQKWFDKAAVAAVGMIVFAPLVALAAYGAYGQYKITEEAWDVIEDNIARKAGGYVPPMPGRCGTCGAASTAGSPFCSSCGASFKTAPVCDSCGTTQRDVHARFCNRCGKAIVSK